MGHDIDYRGTDAIGNVLASNATFIYVFQAEDAPHLKAFRTQFKKDYDVLEESFGIN